MGVGGGCKVASGGITDVHTHLQTHSCLFLAFFAISLSCSLSVFLGGRTHKHTHTHTHLCMYVKWINSQKHLRGNGCLWLITSSCLRLVIGVFYSQGGRWPSPDSHVSASPTVALTLFPRYSTRHINQTDTVCLAALPARTHLHLLLPDLPHLCLCWARHAMQINTFHPGWSGVTIKDTETKGNLQRVTLKLICGYGDGKRIKAFQSITGNKMPPFNYKHNSEKHRRRLRADSDSVNHVQGMRTFLLRFHL